MPWQVLVLMLAVMNAMGQTIPVSERSQEAVNRVKSALQTEFSEKGFTWGAPVFVRIFKDTEKLEIQIKHKDQFTLFKSYPICFFSGQLGPKTKEGDLQAPEGFYEVTPGQMNPNSAYHLSFNLGYPNAYDLAHNYTGSYLMVHGKCESVGCYAMTDDQMEEIYTLLQTAFENGQQSVAVHAFPFEMTVQNLSRYTTHPHFEFWVNLREGYRLFEQNTVPPRVNVKDKKYVFE